MVVVVAVGVGACDQPRSRMYYPPQPKCSLVTEVAPLATFFGDVPPGVSADAAYNATLQFLVTSGVATVDTQDPAARTIVTRPITGQTWTSTCPVNHYFVYTLRIAVTGERMIVAMECRTSVGWEGGVMNGVRMPRDRGELAACTTPVYVSKGDATIPRSVFEGALSVLALDRPPAHP